MTYQQSYLDIENTGNPGKICCMAVQMQFTLYEMLYNFFRGKPAKQNFNSS